MTMPPVKWLIEDGPFSEDLGPMLQEIRKQDMEYQLVKYIPFQSGSYDQYADKDCVISYGSINLIRQLQKEKPWVPGSWCSVDNFKCSGYYPYFGKYLLNQNYVMFPLGDFPRIAPRLFEFFRLKSSNNRIFVRPDSGTKPFVGQVISEKDYMSDFKSLLNYNSPSCMCVASPFRRISHEWRIVIANKKVLAGCQYVRDSEIEVRQEVPENILRFAQIVANNNWEPDPIYIMDICSSEDEYFLLEINSFSCSGLYQCPMPEIVAAAKEAAIREWTDIFA